MTPATAKARDYQSVSSFGNPKSRDTRTFPGPSQLIDSFRRVKELALHLRQLEARALQLLILVRHPAAHKAEPARRLLASAGRRLVPEVALDERAELLLVNENLVLADAREPALEHDLHEPVVLLVRRRGRACKRERGYDSLRIVLDDGLVELLELEIGARNVAVGGPGEVREVRLPRTRVTPVRYACLGGHTKLGRTRAS